MRALHILHHSVPYLDGYSIRSKNLIETQSRLGVQPTVVTSAHHELEVGRGPGEGAFAAEEIGGLEYYRTPLPGGRFGALALKTPFLRERTLIRALESSLRKLEGEHFDLLHAHSPVICGIPALHAARRRGVPIVYEVRAFWEDAMLPESRFPSLAFKYHFSRRLETNLLKRVDAVITLSKAMRDEIAARGVTASKIHVVPNGVDLRKFQPRPRDLSLIERYGLHQSPVLGFIGTFFRMEGITCLLEAMPQILRRQPATKLLLIGGGPYEHEVKRMIADMRLGSSVILVGRVSHEDVLRYYSIIDLVVYPRLRERVTEMTTPLKPLEAMAMGKAVLGSDVGGIRELLDDGRVGMFFKADDSESLAQEAITAIERPELRARLEGEAREYVLRERAWDTSGSIARRVYEDLVHGTRRRVA